MGQVVKGCPGSDATVACSPCWTAPSGYLDTTAQCQPCLSGGWAGLDSWVPVVDPEVRGSLVRAGLLD